MSGGFAMSIPLAFGIPSGFDLLIIAAIVLLLFGNRLPSVMRNLGQGVVEFKKGIEGVEDDRDKKLKKETEAKETKEVKEEAPGEKA
jgi:sec-independent protein translocase protein TatA